MDFQLFKNKFTKEEVRQLNPLVLAFIGDGVYEVFIRSYIIDRNRNMPVHKLHIKTISYVRAHEQSNFMNQLIELLNEEEMQNQGQYLKMQMLENIEMQLGLKH